MAATRTNEANYQISTTKYQIPNTAPLCYKHMFAFYD
jgi:hypothetical protein